MFGVYRRNLAAASVDISIESWRNGAIIMVNRVIAYRHQTKWRAPSFLSIISVHAWRGDNGASSTSSINVKQYQRGYHQRHLKRHYQ